MQIIKVKHNQTLLDIAVQEYGSIEGVFWLVEDNNLDGIASTVHFGDELFVRDARINNQVKSYLDTQDVISTAKNAQGTGIGYMRIGTDFIVS